MTNKQAYSTRDASQVQNFLVEPCTHSRTSGRNRPGQFPLTPKQTVDQKCKPFAVYSKARHVRLLNVKWFGRGGGGGGEVRGVIWGGGVDEFLPGDNEDLLN